MSRNIGQNSIGGIARHEYSRCYFVYRRIRDPFECGKQFRHTAEVPISQAENVCRDAHVSYLGWRTAYHHPTHPLQLYQRTGASTPVEHSVWGF